MKAPLLCALALCLVAPTAIAGTVYDYIPWEKIPEIDPLENVKILGMCGDGIQAICRLVCELIPPFPGFYQKVLDCLP